MFAAVLIVGMLAGNAAGQTEYFVAANGTDDGSNNGLSWAAPLLTISNGVAKATAAGSGSIVTVSNGTYSITAQINISTSITVRSFGNGVYGGLANASNTIVTRASGSIRIFSITHADAVVEGLSITNGYPSGGDGGGVLMTGGTVSNCIVRSNRASGNDQNYKGGGIYASGSSRIVNCRILSNIAGGNKVENEGGGVYSASSTVLMRNCLIAKNIARLKGGGVYLAGGRIENCTIVENACYQNDNNRAGGGVYRAGGTVSNSIVYFNYIGVNTTSHTNIYAAAGSVAYTCTTAPEFSGNGNTPDDPLFLDRAAGDYTLLKGSPCIDTGTNQTWMVGAKDLAGKDRRLYGGVAGKASAPIVDMGAYESYVPPSGTVLQLR